MDWLAGARMHFFETVALRSLTVILMFVLGFSVGAINTCIFVVYSYATFVPANLVWRFPVIENNLQANARVRHSGRGRTDLSEEQPKTSS